MSDAGTLADRYARVAQRAGDSAEQLARALMAAGVSPADLAVAIAGRVATLNAAVGIEGEAMALVELEDLTAPPIPKGSKGRAHYEDRTRLLAAAQTIVTRDIADGVQRSAVIAAAVHRLARAEAADAVRTSFRERMVASGRTRGWTRVLEADACQLCQWWDRDGRTWPESHPLQTHKGCTCGQRYVLVPKGKHAPTVGDRAYNAGIDRARAGTVGQRRLMHEGVYSDRATRGRA